MWKRIKEWFFPRITQYKLSDQARFMMKEMASQTHPKEAFAVLSGKHEKDTLIVTELLFQPFSNTTHSANISMDRYALSGMVGTFHSHPSPNAYPSKADKRLFAKHPGVHCILAYPYSEVHVYSQFGELLGVHAIVDPSRAQAQ